jgi:RNA polymerase sigma-70 factor (ECF subfamily)
VEGRAGRESDDDLLSAIAAGDRDAFGCLMERHAAPMLALAERVSGSAADADEIMQDVFLKVWTLAPEWRSEGPAKFSTWLYRVVLNAAIDCSRRRRELPLDVAENAEDSAPSSLVRSIDRQRRDLVLAAMCVLPDRQRAALSLYYFSELKAVLAAQVLGVSLSAMEALLVRAKRALKTELNRRGIADWGDL